MSSTTIHARISAFEALARSPLPETPLKPARPPSPSPSPPNLGRKTSLIDLKDWVVDDGPPPSLIDASRTPTQQGFAAGTTTGPLINFGSPPKPKPKPKPANLSSALKAPPQLPPRKPSYTSLKSFSSSTSSQTPRKTADSLTVEAAHRYPPLTLDPERARNGNGGQSHVSSSSVSSFHSVSLSEDTEPSTPGSVSNYIATFPMDAVRTSPPARLKTGDSDTTSLTESYENVSASSLTSPASDRLISFDWDRPTLQRKPPPPKLPERPNSSRVASIKSTPPPSHPVSRAASASGSGSIPSSPIIRSAASSSSSALTSPYPPAPYVPRRSAPPPPSRSSDRASIQSTTTTHSQSSSSQHSHASWANNTNHGLRSSPSLLSLKTKRQTPVPSAVRRRYEAVFVANVLQRRRAEQEKHRKLTEAASDDGKPALLTPGEARGRRAVGWRGLSVDLITGDEMVGSSSSLSSPPSGKKQNSDNPNIDEIVGPDERLEGALVQLIWRRSGLDKERLAEIWNECDITGQGALSLEAFVKGMWRIDEELRRAQALAIRNATSGSGASRRSVGQARHSTLSKLNFRSVDNLSPISVHTPNQWPSPKATQRAVPPPPPHRPPQKTRDILR
ncbi:hypothetical protein BDN70DRAFT_885538 [Pholiota conissans]|uniref:EH domain-containing protein n=1 Tax=Pholiota conissans TaxID=109636 RepID=A0A9P5YQV6_9AGAR|nr:hypothetical protein BDN70DRAFT_885538 [Pholiota conissans]